MGRDVADLLDDAADLIERRGWCQGRYQDTDGRLCSVGALAAANGDTLASYFPAVLVLSRRVGDVVGWNDALGRTEQEVLDTFRAAAKEVRG